MQKTQTTTHTTHPAPTFQQETSDTLAFGRAFGVTEASVDTNGRAGVAVAFFYENGGLQFVYFTPAVAEMVFQAEAAPMGIMLRQL
jgi:hypothetical protein